LKGGHAPATKLAAAAVHSSRLQAAGPATKVGGMRVVQHKQHRDEKAGSPAKPTDEDIEEFGEDKKEKTENAVVSGVKIADAEAYPKEAVKAFHEKPRPTHQMGASNKPKIIQQPTKQ